MIENQRYEQIKKRLDISLGIIGLSALILLMWIIGFDLSGGKISLVKYLTITISLAYIIQETARWFLKANIFRYLKERWLDNLLSLFLLSNIIFSMEITLLIENILWFKPELSILIYFAFIQIIIIMGLTVRVLRYNYLISRLKLPPGAIFAISFAFLIILGTLALSLPNSTPEAGQLRLIDALFTSTSAVCVTGLIVLDTAKDFTLLGQLIILSLIQIGGLGVMTLTTFFALFLSGGVSYRFKIVMNDLLSRENLGEVKKLLVKIFIFTITIEAVGALLIYLSIGGSLYQLNIHLIYTSIFHSVSAFCNAGFSIYSAGLMDNAVAPNYAFHSLIMLLIILGGLGFAVLSNLVSLTPSKRYLQKLSLRIGVMTKLVLSSSLILILVGAVTIFVFEPFAFEMNLSFAEKLFHSIFLSVSSRTAGFNTMPIDQLSNAVIVILLPLMWIGASPGSAGGGIKTTTISIALLSLYNMMRGKEKVEIFNREIASESIRKSFLVIIASLIFLGIGSFILIVIEPDKQPLNLIFEACSAISTVGLSVNITSFLGDGGKIVLIALMFVGRIGVLTFFLAFMTSARQPGYTLPKTKIMVG